MRHMKIKASRTNLIKILEKNRLKHVEEYKEACRVYIRESKRVLSEQLNTVLDHKFPNRNLFNGLPEPMNAEEDYDRALSMLRTHVDEEIEIDMNTHEQWVLDNWESGNIAMAKMSNAFYTMVS